MIQLTRLDGSEVVLNADQILMVEKTPDTMLTTVGGAHLLVREPVDAVVARVAAFRRRILQGPLVLERLEGES
ncbi:MAG: flagellar FlbD family protein [Deltaproteobacteria bacterium]|nr:flagellar FlbD family protein [Deltaproteobacteria bacterium]